VGMRETDPITMPGNIPAATIERYKKKGIFTICKCICLNLFFAIFSGFHISKERIQLTSIDMKCSEK